MELMFLFLLGETQYQANDKSQFFEEKMLNLPFTLIKNMKQTFHVSTVFWQQGHFNFHPKECRLRYVSYLTTV
jgi:hypothetical protein